MHRQRRLGMFAVVLCSAFWLATLAVGLMMIRDRGEGTGLGVVEDLLRAASCTATVTAAVLYIARPVRARWFEFGYLAGQRDSRPTRITSIASHAVSEKDSVQDR